MEQNFKFSVPVLPTEDMKRDILWYENMTGFKKMIADHMYVGLIREGFWIHLQWHAATENDPLLGGSVIRIFVEDIHLLLEEFADRGIVRRDKLRLNTPWRTHEFSFYDLNRNVIFMVQDLE